MNVKQMLVPSLLTTILFVALFAASAAEPAYKVGWTQKQFIITFWCPPPPTDPAQAAVAAENYNLTWTPVEGLDMAAKHKLRAILQDGLLNPATLDDPAKRAQLDAIIDKFMESIIADPLEKEFLQILLGYSISGFTWVLLYKEQKYGDKAEDKAATAVRLVWWMTHEGQKYAEPMHYAPLSKSAMQKAEQLLKSATYGGNKIIK